MSSRKFIFIFLWIMIPGLTITQNEAPAIRIMTYNIWYDNPGNAGNTWADRVGGIIKTMDALNPDIICVQEALAHQVADLERSGYRSFGAGRDDGLGAGEFCAILYQYERFKFHDGATFWLSENPESAGSIGWDAVFPRIVTWVKLSDLISDEEFYVFNTHFSHVGDTARVESARLLVGAIVAIAGDEVAVVAGDFNCIKGSEPYGIITDRNNQKILPDARYLADHLSPDPDYSYIDEGFSGQPGNIIDHVFISNEVKVLTAWIELNFLDGRYPSDHLPVLVDFLLQ